MSCEPVLYTKLSGTFNFFATAAKIIELKTVFLGLRKWLIITRLIGLDILKL